MFTRSVAYTVAHAGGGERRTHMKGQPETMMSDDDGVMVEDEGEVEAIVRGTTHGRKSGAMTVVVAVLEDEQGMEGVEETIT